MIDSFNNLIQTVVMVLALIPNTAHIDRKETTCLAKAVYHEARGEDLDTQIAIASFMDQFSRRNQKTICAEISAKGRYPWYGRKKVNMKDPIEKKAWEDSVVIAARILQGGFGYDMRGATHFLVPEEVIKQRGRLPEWYSNDRVVGIVGGVYFLKLNDYS